MAAATLVWGELSILQFPPSLSWHVLPHLRLLKNIQPAACLIWCSKPSPPPPLAQSKRKVRGLWETGNSKTPDSGRRVSGERRGCGNQERGEKGDERGRGDSFQGLLQGPHRERPCYSNKPDILQGSKEGLGIWEMWGRPRGMRKWLRKEADYSGHSQQDYLLGLLAGISKTLRHQETRPCRVGGASWISSGKGHFWPGPGSRSGEKVPPTLTPALRAEDYIPSLQHQD